MGSDRRDLLETLRRELKYLEAGAYEFARAQDPTWRPPFYLEDSPSCFYKWCGSQGERNCTDCVLSQLVPRERRRAAFPCRHIPLNSAGESIEFFYKFRTQKELESELRQWLLGKIAELEKMRIATAVRVA